MVTLRTYSQPMLAQRTDYLCYKCGHWSAYYIKNAHKICHSCKTKLPNLQGLLESIGERKKYHFGNKE